MILLKSLLPLATVAILATPIAANAESFNLVWAEDFNAPLNSWEWNIYNKAPFGSSNNTCFMDTNAWVGSGLLHLQLTLNKDKGCGGLPYASGALDTYTHRPNLTYGRWEVRAKMPAGYGATGYIGLFPVNGSWPPEIDFAEYIGKDKDKLFLTQHYGTASAHQTDGTAITVLPTAKKTQLCPKLKAAHSRKSKTAIPGSINPCKIATQPLVGKRSPAPKLAELEGNSYWTNDFHTYTLEWVPGQLRYYIDGTLQLTQPQRFTATPNMMKLAIGTGTGPCASWSWVGCPDEAASKGLPWPLPTQMRVDYIKMYEYSPTP